MSHDDIVGSTNTLIRKIMMVLVLGLQLPLLLPKGVIAAGNGTLNPKPERFTDPDSCHVQGLGTGHDLAITLVSLVSGFGFRDESEPCFVVSYGTTVFSKFMDYGGIVSLIIPVP